MSAHLLKLAIDATLPLPPSPQGSTDRELASPRVAEPPLLARLDELFAFEAPYLETKLLRLDVVRDRAQARRLFQELKKYLALAELHPELHIPMFSVRVDEAWHQFALFTREYAGFCARFFGRFVHHFPAEAPPPSERRGGREATFEDLGELCRARFGAFEPEWFDELGLDDETRLRQAPWVDHLIVSEVADRALLLTEAEPNEELCRVNRRAAAALGFITQHRHFFIRELPGLRSADERIALCRPLTRSKILRVAL